MPNDPFGVLSDPEEEGGLALVEPVEAHEEEPGERRDAAIVHRPSLLVGLDAVDPGVVRAVAVRPQDRADAFAAQVELSHWLRRRLAFLGLRIGQVEAGRSNMLVHSALEVRQELVTERQVLFEPVADPRYAILDALDPPEQVRAASCEPAGIAIVTAVVAGHRRVAHEAGRG